MKTVCTTFALAKGGTSVNASALFSPHMQLNVLAKEPSSSGATNSRNAVNS